MKKLLIIPLILVIVGCQRNNNIVGDWAAVVEKYGPDIKKIPGKENEDLYLARKEDSSIWLISTSGYGDIKSETELFGSMKIHILNPFQGLQKAEEPTTTEKSD